MRHARAFTLVELLVVIAIISVLAALFLPTLGGAKRRTRSIACHGNLRQLQLAWLSYASGNEGEMVPKEEGRDYGFWEGVRRSWVLGNAQRDTSPENIERGTLSSHVPNHGVYHCPNDRSKVKNDPETDRLRSYSLNGELNYWIVADQTYGLPNLQAFHNESQLRRPGAAYGFLDVAAETIDSGIFGMPGPAAKTVEELRRNLREPPQAVLAPLSGLSAFRRGERQLPRRARGASRMTFKDRGPVSPFGHRPTNDTDMADMRWLVQHGAAWQKYLPSGVSQGSRYSPLKCPLNSAATRDTIRFHAL